MNLGEPAEDLAGARTELPQAISRVILRWHQIEEHSDLLLGKRGRDHEHNRAGWGCLAFSVVEELTRRLASRSGFRQVHTCICCSAAEDSKRDESVEMCRILLKRACYRGLAVQADINVSPSTIWLRCASFFCAGSYGSLRWVRSCIFYFADEDCVEFC